MHQAFPFLTAVELASRLTDVLASPADAGTLVALVVRPSSNDRSTPRQLFLSPERGVEGDRWLATSWKKLPDGRPDPRVQLSLMNSRLLHLVAQTVDRYALAGDNLIVDLDLSAANLPSGQRLSIGEAVVEVSDVPHLGCKKFAARYGPEAMEFINAEERRHLRLRGVYARVVKAGNVRVGEVVKKM